MSVKDGEKVTDFIDCVAWRQTGEFVSKYFTKGRMACVQGSLQMRDWTDKDGNKRRSAEIIASNVYFADSKSAAQNDNSGAPAPVFATPATYATPVVPDYSVIDDDEQLPF